MGGADVGSFLEGPHGQAGDSNPVSCVLGYMEFQLLRPAVQTPWKSSEMGQDDLWAYCPSSATLWP